uniref:Troponin I n=1 Tax=Branchiostoma belcheri TaxID=7741 RepID=Q9NDR9_BRABE|nr:troponin I [Branchiostoma belcheri]
MGEEKQKLLTRERKQQILTKMMKKAVAEARVELEAKAEAKRQYLADKVPPISTSGLGHDELEELCRRLHAQITKAEEEKYDVEQKVEINDKELADLTQRMYSLTGKFKKPQLKRVRLSADKMLKALLGSKHKCSMDFRGNLKAVKKEPKPIAKAEDWRENIEKAGDSRKSKFEGEGEPAE